MPVHIVRQGESLISLSARCGVPVETIWNHADNRSLRERNRKPGILLPGDRITIPKINTKTVAAKTEQRHRFRCQSKTALFKVRFLRDFDTDEPFADEPYVMTVEGRTYEGTLDGDGRLEVRVPATARQAVVRLGEHGENGQYHLRIGHLDPIDEPSGLQQRLKNLGLYFGSEEGESGPATQVALRRFQEAKGLDTTGEADDSTKQSLNSSHGA